MKMYIELGSAPIEEDCAQVGDLDYEERGRKECEIYREQLIRTYEREHEGRAPILDGVSLRVKTNHHDFGDYYEVATYFDDADEKAVDVAFWLEANQPTHWDEEAKRELGIA